MCSVCNTVKLSFQSLGREFHCNLHNICNTYCESYHESVKPLPDEWNEHFKDGSQGLFAYHDDGQLDEEFQETPTWAAL